MHRLVSALVGVVLLAVPGLAMAQDGGRDARLALAQRAVAALQTDQMADQVTAITQAMRGRETAGMTGEELIAYDETIAEVSRTMMARMFNGMIEIYADTYTEEELEALAVFYESPLGQSIMEKANNMTPMIVAMMQEMMPDMMRQMVNGMCDRLDCTPEERREALRRGLAELGMAAT